VSSFYRANQRNSDMISTPLPSFMRVVVNVVAFTSVFWAAYKLGAWQGKKDGTLLCETRLTSICAGNRCLDYPVPCPPSPPPPACPACPVCGTNVCKEATSLIKKNYWTYKELTCDPGQMLSVDEGKDEWVVSCRCPSASRASSPSPEKPPTTVLVEGTDK